MRRIAAIIFGLCVVCGSGCRAVSECVSNTFRDVIFGGLAENYDTSRPPSERRQAYDRYMRENVDK